MLALVEPTLLNQLAETLATAFQAVFPFIQLPFLNELVDPLRTLAARFDVPGRMLVRCVFAFPPRLGHMDGIRWKGRFGGGWRPILPMDGLIRGGHLVRKRRR